VRILRVGRHTWLSHCHYFFVIQHSNVRVRAHAHEGVRIPAMAVLPRGFFINRYSSLSGYVLLINHVRTAASWRHPGERASFCRLMPMVHRQSARIILRRRDITHMSIPTVKRRTRHLIHASDEKSLRDCAELSSIRLIALLRVTSVAVLPAVSRIDTSQFWPTRYETDLMWSALELT